MEYIPVGEDGGELAALANEFVERCGEKRSDVFMVYNAEDGAWSFFPFEDAPPEVLARFNKPVDMLLYCPVCRFQHVDKAEPDKCENCGATKADCKCGDFQEWLNPPHASHRCKNCNHVWRQCDLPTNGVAELLTKGKRDGSAEPVVLDLVAAPALKAIHVFDYLKSLSETVDVKCKVSTYYETLHPYRLHVQIHYLDNGRGEALATEAKLTKVIDVLGMKDPDIESAIWEAITQFNVVAKTLILDTKLAKPVEVTDE